MPDALQELHNKTEKAMTQPDDIQKLYNETTKDVTGVFPASKAEVEDLRAEIRTEFAKEKALRQAITDKIKSFTPVRSPQHAACCFYQYCAAVLAVLLALTHST